MGTSYTAVNANKHTDYYLITNVCAKCVLTLRSGRDRKREKDPQTYQ